MSNAHPNGQRSLCCVQGAGVRGASCKVRGAVQGPYLEPHVVSAAACPPTAPSGQQRVLSYNRFVSTTQHRKDAPKSVRCFVLTISDTRTEANDTSGDAIRDLLSGAGRELTGRRNSTRRSRRGARERDDAGGERRRDHHHWRHRRHRARQHVRSDQRRAHQEAGRLGSCSACSATRKSGRPRC